MIVGNGIDIAEVPRIRQSIERFGSRFLERIFTQSEMHCCDSKANRVARYAARFAAKEAAMKALGTGWNYGVRWRDCEVVRKPGGLPTMHFHGKARRQEHFLVDLAYRGTSHRASHSGELKELGRTASFAVAAVERIENLGRPSQLFNRRSEIHNQ